MYLLLGFFAVMQTTTQSSRLGPCTCAVCSRVCDQSTAANCLIHCAFAVALYIALTAYLLVFLTEILFASMCSTLCNHCCAADWTHTRTLVHPPFLTAQFGYMNDVDWEHLARGTMTFEQFDSFHIGAWANPSHEIVDRQMRLARVRNIYASSQAAQRANNFLRFTRAAAHAVCEDLKASAAIQLHSVQNVVQVDDMMYKLCKSAPHGMSSWSSSPACKPAVLCFLGIVIWVPVNSASMQELTWELLCMLFIGGIISARGACAVVCTAACLFG